MLTQDEQFRLKTVESCVHFWEVLPPTKPESAAACKFCSETRVFSNRDTAANDSPWRRFKVAEANPGREW